MNSDDVVTDVEEFARAILHGDEVHRDWLLDAAKQWLHDKTVPPPRSTVLAKLAPESVDEWLLEALTTHFGGVMVEICEPHPDNPSRTILPVDRLALIAALTKDSSHD